MGACPSCVARETNSPDGLDGPLDARKPLCFQDPCRDPACRMDHGEEGQRAIAAEDKAKTEEESTSIESARYVTVLHRGAGKTTAMLQEAELRDKKRRTLMIKAAEDAISGSIIDHKYFSRIVSLDKRMPREAAILIIQAIIDGKIPAVSMSFL